VDSAADVAADAPFDAQEAVSLAASAVGPLVVGGTGGNDYYAFVTGGLITQASGSFSFLTGAPYEQGPVVLGGVYSPNIYSVQMNSSGLGSTQNQNLPYSLTVNTLCNPSGFPSPNCTGWQQAIYSTNSYGPPGTTNPASLVFEYWLFEFNPSPGCPSGFTYNGTNSNDAGTGTNDNTWNCSQNVYSSPTPPAYPISALGQLTMTVTETASADFLSMTVGAATYTYSGPSVFGLSQAWNQVEFGVYGWGNALPAEFVTNGTANSTTLEVNIAIEATNSGFPHCEQGGTTGESNNLSPICCTSNPGGITALESSVPGLPSTACNGSPALNPWIKLPGGGCATNIAAADGDYPWVTGCGGSRNQIFYWGGSGIGYWIYTTGATQNIAAFNVAAFNNPWNLFSHEYQNYPTIVGTNEKVYVGDPSGSDTGSGLGSSVYWAENTNGLTSGSSISTSLNASSFTNYVSGTSDVLYYSEYGHAVWEPIGNPRGVAEWISVAPDNSSLWAVTNASELWKFSGNVNPVPTSGSWSWESNNVSQAAAGPGGSYAYISNNVLWYQPPVGGVQRLPTGPTLGPSQAGQWGTQLSIGANGNIWVIDKSGNIWEYVPYNPKF
jgi:hypothetical protein